MSPPPPNAPPGPPIPPPPPMLVVTDLLYQEEETVYMDEPADLVPPWISLEGESVARVFQREEYVDAGATAEDARDGFVIVVITGADAVGTYNITNEEQGSMPHIITFTATDAAGNTATLIRKVVVESPCEAPSYMCADVDVCAFCTGNTTDSCSCLDFDIADETAQVVPAEFSHQEDVTPPVMELLPGIDGIWAVTIAGIPVIIHRLLIGQAFVDPGVSAYDLIEQADGTLRRVDLTSE
eukprot:gene18972-22677_t